MEEISTLRADGGDLMEAGLPKIYDKTPPLHQTAGFMGRRWRFHVYDLCVFFRWLYGGDLRGLDLIVLGHSSSLLPSMRWF
jgi:hypothetical protein